MSRWNRLTADKDSFASLGRRLATLTVVVLVVIGLTSLSAPGVLAASFTASNVDISTNDGTISAVTVQPDFDAQWSGLGTGVDNLGYKIEVSDDGNNWETLVIASLDCTNPNADFSCSVTSGSQAIYDGGVTYDLLSDGDYKSGTSPLSASDFSASEGASTTTTVHLKVTVSVDDSNTNTIRETTVTETFDVTVTNTGGSLTITGKMNTNASA